MTSVYAACSGAARQFSKEDGIFTEIDVVNAAAPRRGGWNRTKFKQALTEANQVCATLYREGHLVRFGPVKHGGVTDYARRASKIVYAGTEAGPKEWETPNGAFKQILAASDPVSSGPGRRAGTNRDDTKLWDEQEVRTVEEDERVRKPARTDRIKQLEEKLAKATTELAQARAATSPNGHPSGLQFTLSDEVVTLMVERIMPQIRERTSEMIDEDKIVERVRDSLRDSIAEALIK